MSRRFANQFRRIKPSLQARIDWSHPLANGLLMCCPFNELAGPIRNLCTYQDTVAAGTAPLWSGVGGLYDGTGGWSFGNVPWFNGLENITFAFRVQRANTSIEHTILGKRVTLTNNRSLEIYASTVPRLVCGMANGGSGGTNLYQFNSAAFAVPTDIFLVYESNAGTGLRWKCWYNGAPATLGTTSDSPQAFAASNSPLQVGQLGDTGVPWNGTIEYAYGWAGLRGEETRLALLDDPYCFIDDGPRRVYFVPSALALDLGALIAARSTLRANASVIRSAASRAIARSATTALPIALRGMQARIAAASRMAALPTAIRGASVRIASQSAAAAQLAAIRQMSLYLQARSAMIVGEQRRGGARVIVGDVAPTQLRVGDVVRARLIIGDVLQEGQS